MTLNISDSQRVNGANGTPGSSGTRGTSSQKNGANGTAGTAGSPSSLSRNSQTFLGDSGGDSIRIDLFAAGGSGEGGGSGGDGAPAEVTVSYSSGPNSSTQNVIYDSAGNSGAGGSGGAGGDAAVRFGSLVVDLAGGLTSQNSLRLSGEARGGYGAYSGGSGLPGGSNWKGVWESSTSTSTSNFSTIYSQLGTPGGAAPAGRRGGAGSTGTVSFTDIQVSGENVNIGLFATAFSGAGGGGGSSQRGGSGSEGKPGGRGGDGEDAGSALAEVVNLRVNVTGGLNLSIQLSATGDAGGPGGAGGEAGAGRTINQTSINGVGSSLDQTIYAAAGNGGNGGRGGNATARLRNNTINGTNQADSLTLGLFATGGLGGGGNNGGQSVASSSSTSGSSSFPQRTIVQGIPAGLKGIDGITGLATVEVINNRISLGAGNDTLSLTLLAGGPSMVRVTGNRFEGGIGHDTLILGNQRADERAAVLNVRFGTLSIGNAPSFNAFTGFEAFVATTAADEIIDGGGNQEYTGGGGRDMYTFAAQFAGRDVIKDFSVQDQDHIFLSGFGTSFNFAQLFATATPDSASNGTLINLPGSSSILLMGINKNSLTSSMFTF